MILLIRETIIEIPITKNDRLNYIQNTQTWHRILYVFLVIIIIFNYNKFITDKAEIVTIVSSPNLLSG